MSHTFNLGDRFRILESHRLSLGPGDCRNKLGWIGTIDGLARHWATYKDPDGERSSSYYHFLVPVKGKAIIVIRR